METFEFADTRHAEEYAELLDAIALFADVGCFVVNDGISHYGPRAEAVIESLRTSLIDVETDIDAWPGTIRLPGGGSDRYKFRLNPSTIAVLADAASSVFDWHHRALPDDLHFLRADGSVVFASIGHEGDAWLELSPGEYERWTGLGRFSLRPGMTL